MYRDLDFHEDFGFRRFIETFEVNVEKTGDPKNGNFLFAKGHARQHDRGYRARKMKAVGERNKDGVQQVEVQHGTEFWAPCILVNTGPTLPDIRKVNSESEPNMHLQEQYGLMCLIKNSTCRVLTRRV